MDYIEEQERREMELDWLISDACDVRRGFCILDEDYFEPMPIDEFVAIS